MANGNDAYLDELARQTKGGGAAVAEPEKDSYLAELAKVGPQGTPATPGHRAKGPQASRDMIGPDELEPPPPKQQFPPPGTKFDESSGKYTTTQGKVLSNQEANAADDAAQQDSAFAAKNVKTPFATIPTPGGTPSQRAARLGALPFEPPANTQPRAVRGQFGQPINPLSVEAAMKAQKDQEDHQRYQQMDSENQAEDEREHIQSMGKVGAFAVHTMRNIQQALSTPLAKTPGAAPMPAGQLSPLESVVSVWKGPGTIRPAFEEFSEDPIHKAALRSASQLIEPDNLLLAAGMEILPPTFALSAAGKVLMGSGFTIPMAVNLAHKVPEFADAVKKDDWEKAAEIGAESLPELAFTALGIKDVFEGITQGVNITKDFMRARAEYARRRASETTEFAKEPEGLPSGPAGAAEPSAGTEPEAPPEEPTQSEQKTKEQPTPKSEPDVPELSTEAPLSQKAEESLRRSPLSKERQEDSLQQGISEAEGIARDESVPQEDREMAIQRAMELRQQLNDIVPPKVNRRRTVQEALQAGPTEPQGPAPGELPTEAPIVKFRKEAEDIQSGLPKPEDGTTRLWRGNRKSEQETPTRFTDDLPGIALPFQKGYGGDLSYVDVPTEDLEKYRSSGGPGEFNLSKQVAEQAQGLQDESPSTLKSEREEEAPISKATVTNKLPKELSGAKPRYNYQDKSFELQFDNDVDKSLYIAAQQKPSARDADYMQFLHGIMHPKHTDENLRSYGRDIKEHIKRIAKHASPGVLKVPQHWDVDKLVLDRLRERSAPSLPIEAPTPKRESLVGKMRRELAEHESSPMEKAPPGGFTEADKVSSTGGGVAHYYNEDEGTESTVTKTPQGFAVNMRDTESGNDLGVVRIFKDQTSALNHAQGLVNRFENIPAAEPESGTLPEEGVPADEQPTESGERTELEPVGAAGEGPLEDVPSEDVRGPAEAGNLASEGGRSSGADAGRPSRRDQQPRSGLPERVGGSEGEVSISPERGRSAEPRGELRQQSPGSRAGNDYRITERDNIGSGGERTKYRGNISAIRTLKQIELEGRLATPEEQQTLVKYVGWGGIASNQLFNSETKGGKNWATEHEELKALLSEDEYKRARASTTNAHYTSLPVVKAMWDAMRRVGFQDGSMLEPSAGVGHFLGIEPGDLADGTRRTAIELDPLSGRILKQLYQNADVRIQNFGDFKAPNDHYDIAMGNVPFGKIIVNDSAYNKHKLSIHNYFILKTLDKLRPGGIAALITSAHTLDSMDAKHRDLFAKRADLIGAIRLPNTAFKGNAGTEVTTDILFFRKREPGEKQGGESFGGRQEITSPEGNKIPVNEYFARHPYMMLGDMELAGTMRRAGEPALIPRPDQNLSEELAKAVARLPENAMGERKVPDSTTIEASADAIPDYKEMKQYGLTVKNGRVFRRVGDETIHEVDFPKKQVQVLKEMLGVRDTARELLQAEAKDRSQKELSDLRRRLNTSYDGFVKKNGILHASRNERAMHADPDLPLLLSLEDYDRETKQAGKAAIFRQRVITPTRTITTADNAKDAMLISLGDKGRLDFARMAELTGKPEAELQQDLKSQGLVFESPDGHWETSDRYLSGNVRKKLAAAESAAETDERFKPNAEALKAVIPETVPPSKIFMKLGSAWIPDKVIKSFAAHLLGLPNERNIHVLHDANDASYDIEIPSYSVDPVKNRQQWGTPRSAAEWLLKQGLNLRTPIIYDQAPDDRRIVNPKETAAAEQKMNDINAELKRWTFEDSPYSQEMTDTYNEKLNAHVDWKPDGSHLTFPGMNPEIQLRPYQKNAVWRAVSGELNTLLAHEVGLGKTYIMGAIAQEWRRLGLKKKPLIVFPSHLVPQNSADLMRLYPGANYLIADNKSFETMNRKEFLNRIATGDWDAVIIGDSQFGKMPPGKEISVAATEDMLQTAREELEKAKADGERDTVKVIETQIANFEAILDRYAAKENKDDVTPFNELGVDGLIVDEAHRMKSLPFPTKMGRVRGVPQTKSQRAMDSYIKAQYVTKINNGNGVVFATGTPITNTVAEAWIMMKFLDEKMLQELQMQHFDAWAATFGQSITRAEGSPEDPSKLRMVTRFSKFDNLEQLAKLFRRTADVKFADDPDIQLSRPAMVGGKMQAREVEPSPALLKYIESLVGRAQAARGKKPKKGADNMLVITGDGRKAALDLRMVDSGAEDDPNSKLNQAAQDIANIYHDNRNTKMTQLVGMDFREGDGGFDAYADLRSKLIGLGVPKNEIAFIQDYKTSAKKQKLFSDMNKGTMAVLVGHSDTLGVGVNVQKKLGAVHILAPPYRPDQVEQTVGRGIRWGNENKEVIVRNYVTQRSFDVNLWDVLTRKAEFIRSLMKGETNISDIGDLSKTSMNYAEMKAAASGDQRLFRKIELESTLQRLQMVHSSYKDQQFDNRTKIAQLPERIETNRKLLDATRADRTTWDAKPEKFAMTVGKRHFSDRKEAGAALNAALQGSYDKGALLGEYGGFKISSGLPDQTGRGGYLRDNRSWDFKMGQGEANEKGIVEPSPVGTIQSLERIGNKIESSEKYLHEQVPKLMQELEDRKEQLEKPFEKQKELDKAKAELDKLNDELGYNNITDKDQDDGDDEGGGGPEEPPDDLTMSFMGLQNIYNRIQRAMSRMRARRGAVAAGGGSAGKPPKTPGSGLSVEAPEPPQRGAEPGEKAINIRLDKLNTSDEVLDLIREVARQNPQRINAQRRGVLHDKDLKDRMEEVGLDAEKLMKMKAGKALNEAEMQVAIGIMLDKGQKVREAAKKAAESDTTENLLELRQLESEYVAIQAAVSGAKAESGRALRIQRLISEAFQSENKSNYEKVLDSLGGRSLTEEQRRKLLQIPENDRIGLARFLRDTAKFHTSDKIMAYWINNILSGTGTIQRKLLGDAAMAVLALPMRPVRALIDPAMAKLQGRPQEFFMRDTAAQTLAYMNAFSEGLKKGAFQVWNGFDLDDLEQLDIPRYQIGQTLLPRMLGEKAGAVAVTAANMPTRLLSGATTMFKTMHKIAAIHGLAMRQALKEGLTGQEAGDRAAELVAEVPDWMDTQATKEAEELAMIEKPDRFTKKLMELRDVSIPEGVPLAGLAPFKFVIPFIQIGTNIAKNAARYSPVGAARYASKGGRTGPEASTIAAQTIIGSAIMAAMYMWYLNKKMTGAPPKTAAERDAYYRSGKQPFSVKIGNRWASYLRGMGPMGLLAAAVVAWAEAHEKNGQVPTTDQIGQVAAATLNGVRDQSFFRGVQNLDQAVSEPGRLGAQWLAEIASGFVPFSGLARNWADALDPEMRDPQGIYERIKSGIPFASKSVTPRLDVLGRPAQRRGAEGAKAFLATAIPEDKPESDIDGELARLHSVGLKNPGFTGRFLMTPKEWGYEPAIKMGMGRKEQNEYLQMRGSALRGSLDQMFKDPDYKAMPDQDKITEVESMIRDVDTWARQQMAETLAERRLGTGTQQGQNPTLPIGVPGGI